MINSLGKGCGILQIFCIGMSFDQVIIFQHLFCLCLHDRVLQQFEILLLYGQRHFAGTHKAVYKGSALGQILGCVVQNFLEIGVAFPEAGGAEQGDLYRRQLSQKLLGLFWTGQTVSPEAIKDQVGLGKCFRIFQSLTGGRKEQTLCLGQSMTNSLGDMGADAAV